MLKKLIPLVLITFLSACACHQPPASDCCCKGKEGVQCQMKDGKKCCKDKDGKECCKDKDGKECCCKKKHSEKDGAMKDGVQCPMKGKQGEAAADEKYPSE